MNKLSKLGIVALTLLVLSIAMSAVATAQYDDYDWTYEDSAEAAGIMALFGGIMCFVVIGIWVVWLVLAIWVYKDAEKRGKSGILWFLIVFFLGIIGLIIWLVVRGEKTSESGGGGSGRMCPNCGRPIPMDARTCPYCSKKFEE